MYVIKDDPVIQATTNGGPGTASEVFSTVMYKSFGNGRLGERMRHKLCAGNCCCGFCAAAVPVHSEKRG